MLHHLSRTGTECDICIISYLELVLSVVYMHNKLSRTGTECGIVFINYLELVLGAV